MKYGKFALIPAIAASAFLAACGGSEPTKTPSSAEAKTPTAIEAAAAEVEAAAEEAQATATAAAAEAEQAVKEQVETVTAAAADAAQDASEAAESAVEAVTETVTSAVTNDRITPEIVAAYAALTGDAGNGRRVFTKCMSCHVVAEGQNRSGPSLYKVVGRTAGTVDKFRYSPANADSGIVWTEETLFAYLEAPQEFIPGTYMAFPGLKSPQDRADVIAYIQAESK